jgi:hypothetical protein
MKTTCGPSFSNISVSLSILYLLSGTYLLTPSDVYIRSRPTIVVGVVTVRISKIVE